jgi:hypothetical protein
MTFSRFFIGALTKKWYTLGPPNGLQFTGANRDAMRHVGDHVEPQFLDHVVEKRDDGCSQGLVGR